MTTLPGGPPSTGRIASPLDVYSSKLVESPELESYQKVYNFLNGSEEKFAAPPPRSRATRPMSQAGMLPGGEKPVRAARVKVEAEPVAKATSAVYGRMQNKRSKSSSNSIQTQNATPDSVYKIYGPNSGPAGNPSSKGTTIGDNAVFLVVQTKHPQAAKRRRTENKSFVGSYQANRPQFLPSPGKTHGTSTMRSPSPNESSADAQAYAALKSSLAMMCQRQNVVKTPQPVEAWGHDLTRNKAGAHKQVTGKSMVCKTTDRSNAKSIRKCLQFVKR